ncbi:hypothetical protein PC128_g14397 [Phytophthora cactorum]|nr:hypothetical protein PC128_g14397 [Phytophthora cactorum]
MQRTLQKLVAMQEASPSRTVTTSACNCAAAESIAPPRADVVVEAHSLAGCLYNWDTLELCHTATQKKQRIVCADLKACINVMIIAGDWDVDVPSAPLERDGVVHQLWKQTLWMLAESLNKTPTRRSAISTGRAARKRQACCENA